jgi:hypothetical protein
MSRTSRINRKTQETIRDGKTWDWNKESKPARKQCARIIRHSTELALHDYDHDADVLPEPIGTCGWNTH